MKKLLFLFLIFPLFVFGQQDTSGKAAFGKPVSISQDSLRKLPINDMLAGKWVLISSKAKKGHDEDMIRWNFETLELSKDRTVTMVQGPKLERKMHWSYAENPARLIIFSWRQGEEQRSKLEIPILKMDEAKFVTPEWVSPGPDGKYFMKLTFLKVE